MTSHRMTPHSETPLLEALKNHAVSGRLGFHTPGHQSGRGLPPAFSRFMSQYGVSADLTELAGLDNLSAPAGVIAQSQEAMARVVGSKHAYYMVNGATGGLLAAMLAMSGPGVRTIIPAHCHTSIYQGLVLTGARPVILPCLMDTEWNLPIGIDWRALDSNPLDLHGETLWVSVNPTYHGVMADLAREKALLETMPGASWLVDEAHGAHLPFTSQRKVTARQTSVVGGDVARGASREADNDCAHDVVRVFGHGAGRDDAREASSAGRGLSAIDYPADVVAHSAHKMGTGLTQTGVLHCNRESLERKLRQAVNIVQTTSPSYLLLASLDAWQAFLREDGAMVIKRTEALAAGLTDRIRSLGAYRVWRDELGDAYVVDVRKITLSARELGLSGSDLAGILSRDYQIDTELARDGYVLLIVNLGHTEKDMERLIRALGDIKERRDIPESRGAGSYIKSTVDKNSLTTDIRGIYSGDNAPIIPVITPREAFFKRHELIPISKAEGRLSAGFVTPYPPGIPILFPGMSIRADALRAAAASGAGLSCAGLISSGGESYVEVIAE